MSLQAFRSFVRLRVFVRYNFLGDANIFWRLKTALHRHVRWYHLNGLGTFLISRSAVANIHTYTVTQGNFQCMYFFLLRDFFTLEYLCHEKKMFWVLVQEFLTMIALVLAVFLTRSKQRTSRASFGHSAKPVLHYERSKHNCAGINCLFMLGMGLQTNFLDVWPCCMHHWQFALVHAVC